MPSIVHWDEVERERAEVGSLAGYWTDLGSAAGSVRVGVNRVEVDPNKRSTPLHMEGDEEEVFFVLAGSGLSWQFDGDDFATYEIRPGDCLVHRAEGEAHSVVAGPEGIDYLAFGTRAWARLTYFPRIEGARMGPAWAEKLPQHQWERENALGDPELPEPSARPPRIVNLDEVEAENDERGVWRGVAAAAGAERTGLNLITTKPGRMSSPLHCHSAEEELFVVLDGEGVCILGDDEHPVRRGSVVSRPPATRIAHGFRAGDSGLTYLAYGTREPNDIAYYPRSNKFYLRGIGLMARIQRLDYWDGEE
jgi:uncharacterized cupin superfamily protein